MTVETDALIDELSENAEPVRRLRPSWLRAVAWLALGIPPLLAVALIDGIKVDPRSFLHGNTTSIEIAAILATALTAAGCAFASTVPGASRKWLALPAIPFVIWLANIGKACIDDWTRSGLAGLLLRVDGPCVLPMVAMSIVPLVAMFVMLRRGAPVYPKSTLLLGAVAIAALTTFGLRLVHGPDISIQVLVWSLAVVAISSALLRRGGRPVLGWRNTRSGGVLL